MKNGKILILLSIMAFVIMGCNKMSASEPNGKKLGVLKVVDRIKLKKPGLFRNIIVNDGIIYGYDYNNKALVIYAKNKEPIYYSRIGKGPGEWNEYGIEVFAVDGTLFYAQDTLLNKILVFSYKEKENSIAYVDEYIINDGVMNRAILHSDGKIYVSLRGGKNMFAVYKKNGTFENFMIPVNKIITINNDEWFLEEMTYPIFINDTLFAVNSVTYEIKRFERKNNEYVPSGNFTLNTIYNKKPWDIKRSGNGRIRILFKTGIGAGAVYNNMLLLMVADKKNNPTNFFQAYDVNGTYKGYYSFENKKDTYAFLGYDTTGKVYCINAKNKKEQSKKIDEILVGEFETAEAK